MYLKDSYLKEWDAVVRCVDGNQVVLDRTAFYPAGGGQPTDTGIMTYKSKEYKVLSVKKIGPDILHETNETGLATGDVVHCRLDWNRRYVLMRMHTAAHLLCAIINSETGALITGNQLDIGQSRIDFSLEKFDKDKLIDYISKANNYIRQDLHVKVYSLPREEAIKIPGITKLATGLPAELRELRIVEIPGVDIQADGGTHVKSLKEIGTIRFVRAENKGKNNRRVYYSLT